MNAISLQIDDLAALASLAQDLDFDDAERREALLESGSRDFNAVPGSGKTSLLAAKLLLLAKKWPHARRGICVLSHTNVARDEIAKRLAGTSEGAQLLSYPHYVGTIHSFINQFFALPMLRSLGNKVEVIDNAVFAEKAIAMLRSGPFSSLRFFLERKQDGMDIVSSLSYRTASLTVIAEDGNPPGPHTDSYKALVRLKKHVTSMGIFRHSDMFAYADLAMQTCPHIADVVHRRFPMVFIDEMQDTSWDQESLLNAVFDGKSIMQRFGDVDQKILSDEKNCERLTFPRKDFGSVSTSKRFGKTIAHAVSTVRLSRKPVTGEGENMHAPVLLLYPTSAVTEVVPHFGKIVLETLGAADLLERDVKVMCARKASTSKEDAGRYIGDYCPTYGDVQPTEGARLENFWSLIGDAGKTLQATTLSRRVADVRRALLLVLRAANAPISRDVRDARAIARAAREHAPDGSIEALTRQLVLSGERLCADEQHKNLVKMLYENLKSYLSESVAFETFKALKVLDRASDTGASAIPLTNICEVTHQGKTIRLGLGTVAIMKGETHAASLVLESHGGTSRKFDIALGLEYIADSPSKPLLGLTPLQQAQMRNLYVAMSRPTLLLCLAANENRVPEHIRTALVAKGWRIETVTQSPER